MRETQGPRRRRRGHAPRAREARALARRQTARAALARNRSGVPGGPGVARGACHVSSAWTSTGHTTLAEWTRRRSRRPSRPPSRRSARSSTAGYFAMVSHRRGPRRAGPRAAGRRRARDHAPADRRRLATGRRVAAEPLPELRRPSTGARASTRARLRPHAARCGRDHRRPRRAVHRRGRRAVRAPAAGAAGQRSPASRTPGSSPSSTRSAAPTSCGPSAAARRPSAEARSVGLLGDLVGHEARDLHARTGLVLERGAPRRLARRARRARCSCGRGGRRVLLLLRAASTTRRCPAATASPTCCSRCAPTRQGFATVANLAFTGARWRVRRRLAPARAPGARRRRVAAARRLDTPGHAPEQRFRTRRAVAATAADRHHAAMSAPSAVSAARVLLVERRDTVAQRDPDAAEVRRYRLARLQLNGRADRRAAASSTCAARTTETAPPRPVAGVP